LLFNRKKTFGGVAVLRHLPQSQTKKYKMSSKDTTTTTTQYQITTKTQNKKEEWERRTKKYRIA